MHGLDPTNPSFLFSLTLLTTRQFTFHNYSDWHGCLLGSFVELIITSSKDFSCFVELVQILYSQSYFSLNRSLTGSKPQTGEYNLSTFMPVCASSPLWRLLLVSWGTGLVFIHYSGTSQAIFPDSLSPGAVDTKTTYIYKTIRSSCINYVNTYHCTTNSKVTTEL